MNAKDSKERGRLVVVSAPSGTGKSTVCGALVRENDDAAVSISYTTRAPRGAEQDGVEYHFVDDEQFDRMVAAGEFLEWAHVHERRYGSARADVERMLAAGIDVFFDIDVQGGQQIKRQMPEALLVFILPPSIDELVKRLTGRGTESHEQLAIRLQNAVGELKEGLSYDCQLVNAELQNAVSELNKLRQIPIEQAKQQKMISMVQKLLEDGVQKLSVTS